MKKYFIFIFSLLCYIANGQDANVKELKSASEKTIKKDPADTIARKWKTGGLFNLNINQGSLSNWSAGGDKFSFSLNTYLQLYSFYKHERHSWDNNLELAYGIVKTTSLGNRKSADRMDLLSKYGYAIGKHWNLAALFNFRSQFANGYSYNKNVAGGDSATVTSRALNPAYAVFSLGFDYKPKEQFSLFISPLTARWVIVGNDNIAPLFGVEPGKNARYEMGAFVSANYATNFHKNFTFKSRLDLFSNYRSNPENIDIFWSNVLTAKLSNVINFSFNVDMIYDDNTQNVDKSKGPAPQWLQLMGIGFAYSFRKK